MGGVFYLTTGTGELIPHQGTMEPLDVSPNDPIFFLHHANVDRIWASWQVANPGPDNYLPQGGEPVCPYPLADDAGPDDPAPQVSDAELKAKNAAHIDDAPWPGMRLNDWMYPYCLERYASTIVHDNLTPADQIELEPLGYTYADLYAVAATV
ncbi:MAG: tyrosinase family protein [Chloroflexota bacterium]